MSKVIHRHLIGFLFGGTLLIASAVSLSAQQNPTATPRPQATEHPDGPAVLMPAEEMDRLSSEHMTLEADLMSRSIFDYKVGYWIGEPEAEEDQLFSAEAIEALTGAQTFSDFEDFKTVDLASPFEIVIVHPSFYESVDRQWAAKAFDRGVFFMGIDLTVPQLSDLIQKPCLAELKHWKLQKDFHMLTVIGYRLVTGDVFDDCETTVGSGRLLIDHFLMMKPEAITTMPDVLTSNTYNIGLPNRSAERSEAPTSTPTPAS